MPGLDYLESSGDPRDGGYFDGMTSAVAEFGVGIGGSWALNRFAKNRANANKRGVQSYKKARERIGKQISTPGYLSDMADRAGRNPNVSPRERFRLREIADNPDLLRQANDKKYSAVLGRRQGVKDLRKMSSTLSKASVVYGLFTAAVMGWQLGSEIVRGSRSFAESSDDVAQRRRMGGLYNGNDEYFDSRAAFTQRQRALQVIHNSQLSTRAALGSEAGFLHY